MTVAAGLMVAALIAVGRGRAPVAAARLATRPRVPSTVITDGLNALIERSARAAVGSLVATNLLAGLEAVLFATAARQTLHTGPAGYGMLNAASGLGAVGGLVLATVGYPRHRSPSTAALLGVAGAAVAALALVGSVAVAAIVTASGASAAMAAEVRATRHLQHAVRPDSLSPAFALLDAVMVVSILVGVAGAPLLTGGLGGRCAFVMAGLGIAAVAAASRPLRPRTKAGNDRQVFA
jgi:hypothetical protein